MPADLPNVVRASVARTAVVVLLVAAAGAVSSCEDDADGTPDSDPTGSLLDSSVPGEGSIATGSSLPPQATPAPNPNAGSDGAPSPGSTVSP
jgi:hypothetical protein